MLNEVKMHKEELDDYKYLYGDEEDILEDILEDDDDFIDDLDITNIDNYDYIKNIKNNTEEVDFLLDKDCLDNLDNEDTWDEITKLKRRSVPPKEPLSTQEKNTIAVENTALVHYVIKSLHGSTLDYQELESIASVGYAKALNSYDKSKNVKFSTYAINCIRNEIFYVLRKEKKHTENTVSLNKVLSTDKNGNSLQLGETLSQSEMNQKSLEEIIIEGENKEILLRALNHLKEEEKFILMYRFGLDRGIVKTQKEIADAVGMSQANVSKIQKSSLNKLKLILMKEMKNR